LAGTYTISREAQRIKKELTKQIKSWSGRFEWNNTIIDKKFIHLDEELEKVVDLVGQKIDAKFREFVSDFMEAVEIEENHQKELETKVSGLEERLEHTLAHVANLAALLLSVQSWVGDLEDTVMDVSDEDAKEDTAVSSSLSDVDLVENMVAILFQLLWSLTVP
jgi:hypothetical protein